MCEVLIIAHSKTNPNDVHLDTKLHKRGDVVTVQPDGWNWAHEELTNPLFRILKLPNVDVATASTLLAWEQPVPGTNASVGATTPATIDTTCQRRKVNLNLDSLLLPAALAAYIADDTRASPSFSSNVLVSGFGAWQVTKAVVPLPALVGTNPAVI